MSSLISRLQRLVGALFVPATTTLDPDSMSLNAWADLPSHHPVCR